MTALLDPFVDHPWPDDMEHISVSGSPFSMMTGVSNGRCMVLLFQAPDPALIRLGRFLSSHPAINLVRGDSITKVASVSPGTVREGRGLCIDANLIDTAPHCEGCTAVADWAANQVTCTFPSAADDHDDEKEGREKISVGKIVYEFPAGTMDAKYRALLRELDAESKKPDESAVERLWRKAITIGDDKSDYSSPVPLSPIIITVQEAASRELARLNVEVSPRICEAVRSQIDWAKVLHLAGKTRAKVLRVAGERLIGWESSTAAAGKVGLDSTAAADLSAEIGGAEA